jgi:putative ABC transport system ATP-binding protein
MAGDDEDEAAFQAPAAAEGTPGDGTPAIAGPSGSGKTTMLQLLGALDRASAGTVLFEGRDLARLGDRALAELRLRRIGFVFQQFNLIPTLTALQNVEAALAPAGVKSAEATARAAELLGRVGLAERLGHLGYTALTA